MLNILFLSWPSIHTPQKRKKERKKKKHTSSKIKFYFFYFLGRERGEGAKTTLCENFIFFSITSREPMTIRLMVWDIIDNSMKISETQFPVLLTSTDLS